MMLEKKYKTIQEPFILLSPMDMPIQQQQQKIEAQIPFLINSETG